MWRGTTSALNKINGTNFLCSTKADSTCLILTDVKYTLERQLDDSLADALGKKINNDTLNTSG